MARLASRKKLLLRNVEVWLENATGQDQSLTLKLSTLLAVCGVGVDESCTVKVRL
jgi:hypothetical protein